MRAIVQRVASAAVGVGGDEVAAIGPGLLVLLGVGRDDGEAEADRLAAKLLALRVFDDGDGRMSRSVGDLGGALRPAHAGDPRERRPGDADRGGLSSRGGPEGAGAQALGRASHRVYTGPC